MMTLLQRHFALVFIALSASMLLLRHTFGFSYAYSVVLAAILVGAKLRIDSRTAGHGILHHIRNRLLSTFDEAREIIRLEKNVHLALVGKYPRPTEKPTKFKFNNTNEYGVVAGLVLIAAVIEIPLLHLAIHALAPPKYALFIHIFLAFVSIYTLVWVVSDMRAINNSAHYLDESCLHIQLGWRVSGDIRLKDISHIEAAPESLRAWRKANDIDAKQISRVTPLDAPNVLVVLRDDHSSFAQFLFVKRRLPKYVAFYVNGSQHLLSQLTAALGSRV